MPWRLINVGLWALFVLVWLAAAPFSRKTVRREPIASRLRYLAFGLVAGFLLNPRLFPIPLLDGPDLADAMRTGHLLPVATPLAIFSVALTALGIAFAFWARFTLGRNWSGTVTLKEDHTLVQTGPYALARHPIYTGALVGILGTLLGIGLPPLRVLLGMVPLLVAFRVKMATEERFMTEHFGDAYPAYRQRVKGLIPFVW
jgi:protein-S-isoprenylcysteine O-methyltransferase Ste14